MGSLREVLAFIGLFIVVVLALCGAISFVVLVLLTLSELIAGPR